MSMMEDAEKPENTNLVKKPVPPAIQRLLDEVRAADENKSAYAYDRQHNRHNRS